MKWAFPLSIGTQTHRRGHARAHAVIFTPLQIARRIKVERCDRLAFSNCARTAWQLFTLIPYIWIHPSHSKSDFAICQVHTRTRRAHRYGSLHFEWLISFGSPGWWRAHCKTALAKLRPTLPVCVWCDEHRMHCGHHSVPCDDSRSAAGDFPTFSQTDVRECMTEELRCHSYLWSKENKLCGISWMWILWYLIDLS